jgi:hypothetical protein
MESMKRELLQHMQAKYGSTSILELETSNGYCMKMFIAKHPQYTIYMRDNSAGDEVHCYYIHREDLEMVETKFKEIQSYREQFIQQMLRRYKGGVKDFVSIGKTYLFDASWRMDGFKAMGGSRKSAMTETFENMKWFRKNVPEPKPPAEKDPEELRKEKALAAWKKSKQPPTELQLRIKEYMKMRLSRPSTGARKHFV